MKNIKLIKSRKKKNYTQQDLANRLGVKTSTVSNWETGYSQPSLDTAIRISFLLDEGVAFLFDRNVQEYHTKSMKESDLKRDSKEDGK